MVLPTRLGVEIIPRIHYLRLILVSHDLLRRDQSSLLLFLGKVFVAICIDLTFSLVFSVV